MSKRKRGPSVLKEGFHTGHAEHISQWRRGWQLPAVNVCKYMCVEKSKFAFKGEIHCKLYRAGNCCIALCGLTADITGSRCQNKSSHNIPRKR